MTEQEIAKKGIEALEAILTKDEMKGKDLAYCASIAADEMCEDEGFEFKEGFIEELMESDRFKQYVTDNT